MCKLYRVTTNVDAMRRLFKVTGSAPILPHLPEIYPRREAPIIRADAAGERRIELASWGVGGPPGTNGPVINISNLASPFWRSALTKPERRCLVPGTGFALSTIEPDATTGRKRKIWLEMCDGTPFVFAGICFQSPAGEIPRFAFLTCAPNVVVDADYPQAMPVILHGAARDAWLTAEAAAALAVPLADELMRVAE